MLLLYAQVERRLGLADCVEIYQPALLTVEDQLRVGVIAVAEAKRQRVGLFSVGLNPLQPSLEAGAQLGRDPLNLVDLLLQRRQLAIERAAAAQSDI